MPSVVGGGLVWAAAGFAAGLGVGVVGARRFGGSSAEEEEEATPSQPPPPAKKVVDPSGGDVKKGKKIFVSKCAR